MWVAVCIFLGGLGGRGGGGTPRGGLLCCASWLLEHSPPAALVGLARDGPLEGGRAHPRGPASVRAADYYAAASSRVASAASALFLPVCAGRLVHGGVRAAMMALATGSASAPGALTTRSFASLLRTRTCNANERRKESPPPRRHRDTPRMLGRATRGHERSHRSQPTLRAKGMVAPSAGPLHRSLLQPPDDWSVAAQCS